MIKKTCSFILVLAITVSLMAFAWADVNLAELSDDEILQLAQQLDAEAISRGLPKTATLPKGTYLIGRDIPAGSYVYTCLATENDWGNVTVYADGGEGDQLLWNVVSAPEEGENADTIFLRVNDGDEFKSGVPFSLTIAAGLLFK